MRESPQTNTFTVVPSENNYTIKQIVFDEDYIYIEEWNTKDYIRKRIGRVKLERIDEEK